MRYLNAIALLLVIGGGLNWLLVGLFQFDLVAALTGAQFGEVKPISAVIYALVGVSAIVLIPVLMRWLTTNQEEPLHA
jgi:uncharacterized membrane protein YuzA (DUF378 family)